MKKTKKTNKITINDIDFDIPAGVNLLTEDGLYSVNLDLVKYADPLSKDEPIFKWFNFRHVTKKGLGEEDMSSLKASIQSRGLMYPIICRWYSDTDNNLQLQLIEGERRCRAIRELIAEDKECWSKTKNKMLPAKEVYESISCRIITGDDKECLKVALSIQDNNVDWGEGAKTRIVMSLRSTGCNDDEILDITKKSIAWLREEDHLATLDEKTFSFYENGKINRSVALRLLKVEDIEIRHKYLDQAYTFAVRDFEENLKEAKKDLDKAEQKEEVAEANLTLLEESGKDEESIQEAKETYKEAKEKTAAKKEKKEALEEKGVQTKTKHLVNAAKENIEEESAESLLKSLNPLKLKKQQERLEKLIEIDGKLEDKIIIPSDVLEWLIAIYNGILSGEESIDKILKRQYNKQKLLQYSRKKKDVIIEDKDIEEDEDLDENDMVESIAAIDATLDEYYDEDEQ